MPRTAEKPSTELSDEELGVGVEDHAQALAALMETPAFKALIDKAVAERLVQGADSGEGQPDLQRLVTSMERMFQIQASQMPGYQKPLSADEVERRLAGKVEMEALLRECEQKDNAPRYILGGKFYAGDVLYDEGQEIRTFLPPAEHFRPVNEAARNVYSAFLQHIGGETQPIGEQVEAAMLAAKTAPLIGNSAVPLVKSPVEVVAGTPRHNVRPNRVAGTIMPETHGVSMPSMPATAPQPQGPVFINP